MLEVVNVDFHLPENTKSHHTDRYEISQSMPIYRRSQPFLLSITFNREFNKEKDRARLFFTHGKEKVTPRLQSMIENTTITSSNRLNDSKDQWSLQIQSFQQSYVTVLVRSPSQAAWGIWNLMIKTSVKTSAKTNIWKSPTQFYLIYNPWAQDDEVFMPDTRYLDEYILNDVGKVYTSSVRKPIGMKWIFGQFSASVIEVIRRLLDEQKLDEETLGNPVQLCYHLARSVGNIVEGNWSGNFKNGTPPWLWTGSISIYDEFLKTNQPVKYAQCFIYSAVFTTALRAVGIPARSVTNFVSATGGRNMAVNHVFDKGGNTIESASIWNFHVWNDAWMARYDLSPGYGGWQATDATNGIGPAPLEGIRKGEICLYFDCRDILGEVNSDRVRWTVDDNGKYHLINIDTKHIGRAMLTKQPFIYDPHGDTDYQDIILDYKEPEGSKEERMSLYNAIKHCKAEDDRDEWHEDIPYHVDIPSDDKSVTFSIQDIEAILFGEPLVATVIIENKGDKEEVVECCLGASAMYYNGATAGLIQKQTKIITIQSTSRESLSVCMTAEEYGAKLVEFTHVKIHAIATVKRTNFTWADDLVTIVDMPEITICSQHDLEEGKVGVLQFQFVNLLKTKLTNCSLTYEAPGIGRNVKIQVKDVEAGQEAFIEAKVKPDRSGEISVKAVFTSKQLRHISGSNHVLVF